MNIRFEKNFVSNIDEQFYYFTLKFKAVKNLGKCLLQSYYIFGKIWSK